MADRRGKCYACLHCQAQGKTYVEVRYRMVAHIYKHHLALDKAPFYCTLCLLRCSTKSSLLNHVSKYSRHRQAIAELGQVDSQRFLVENPDPATLIQGIDFRELTSEEASRMVLTKPAPESGDEAFDAYDHQFVARPLVTLNQTQSTMNSNLISIQVTPEVLATLVSSKSSPSIHSTSQALQQQEFVPYSPAPSLPFPTYTPTPIVKIPEMLTQQIPEPVTKQPLSFPQPPLKKPKLTLESPVPLITTTEANQTKPEKTPSVVNPMLSPLLTSTNTVPIPSTSLSTPVLGSTTNFLDQYVDSASTELDYDFDDDLTVKSLPLSVQAQEKATNTNKTTEAEAKPSPRKEEPTQSTQAGEALVEVIRTAVGRLVDAFEQNSRAIRGIDKTLGTLTDVVTKMSRTLERMGEEQRREHERRTDELRDMSRDRSRESTSETYRRERSRERTTVTHQKPERRSEQHKSTETKADRRSKENKPLKSIINKK